MNAGGKRKYMGGRSDRPERRGPIRQAPQWTSRAAMLAATALDAARGQVPKAQYIHWAATRGSTTAWEDFMGQKVSDAHHKEVARGVMAWHLGRIGNEQDARAAARGTKHFLDCLNRATKGVRTVRTETLRVVRAKRTLTDFLGVDVPGDRRRCADDSAEVLKRLREWGPQPTVPTVVVPERAESRVREERDGVPDAAFLRGVVFTEQLPTLTAKTSDHYFSWDRMEWWSVGETALSAGVRLDEPGREQPLWRALRAEGGLSAAQAVSALGRGVHGVAATAALNRLLRDQSVGEGREWRHLTYGSAYSGIDTVAAAFEDIWGPRWTYVFAAERHKKLTKALKAAWGCRGLRRVHSDAADIVKERYVDIFVITPECVAFSKRNRKATMERQARSLRETEIAFRYVRAQRPATVLVENVDEPSVVTPMSAMLGDLSQYGYDFVRMPFCPRENGGEPVKRKRSFWIGVRKVWRPPMVLPSGSE